MAGKGGREKRSEPLDEADLGQAVRHSHQRSQPDQDVPGRAVGERVLPGDDAQQQHERHHQHGDHRGMDVIARGDPHGERRADQG